MAGWRFRPAVKKKDLEIILQGLAPHPRPSERLEQYATPAGVAAEVLFFAAQLGDIQGKKVVDLGCGTGILAIGAKAIGAREVVALDLDEAALAIAMKNASGLGLDVGFLTLDVAEFPESCDTVLMNPPFGAQQAHADLPSGGRLPHRPRHLLLPQRALGGLRPRLAPRARGDSQPPPGL